MIDINDFIVYSSLFEAVYAEQKDVLHEYRKDIKHYDEIIRFHELQVYNKMHGKQVFEILTEECVVEHNKIVFVYGMDFDDANESCTQCSTADYIIIYDREMSKFINCEYQQG